jgi:hypothetical protein
VGCGGLQHLVLVGCIAVTDAGLRAIDEGCGGLQHLDLVVARAPCREQRRPEGWSVLVAGGWYLVCSI